MKAIFRKQQTEMSIRKQILHFSAIVFSVFITLLLFYNIINYQTIEKYNSTFNNYRDLSTFYTSIDSADQRMRDYLYTDNASSLRDYNDSLTDAFTAIENLRNTMEDAYIWRIDLLENMLESYVYEANATQSIFEKGIDGYLIQYNKMLNTSSLIIETNDAYFNLLIEQMEAQNITFSNLKSITILISVTMAFIMIFWLLYFIYRTLNLITNPLDEIVKNINRVKQGEYDLSVISNTGSEMHELCDALEDMAKAVQNDVAIMKTNAELEKRLLEIENENLRKDEMLAQSEVRMLQNQINPHFLFNTLNMTYKLALQEGAPRCSEMIERTSALLRYGLDKQNKLSDLESEIKAIENYLAIQEKRLGDRVHFELNVASNIPNISIPGMIVQPLIENALKHGLQDMTEDGEVITSFHYERGYVIIQVSDNGTGVESELLEDMILSNFQDIDGEHLGLYNVTKRLEMFYQDKVDISVNSALDCGFEFIIRIEV